VSIFVVDASVVTRMVVPEATKRDRALAAVEVEPRSHVST
jgi:hypothetical protein